MKKGNLAYYFLGHLLCFIASFSAAHGLFTWVACLPLFLNRNLSGRRKRALFVSGWIAGFILSALAYFSGYAKPPYHPETTFTPSHLPRLLDYYFNFIGGVFGNNDTEVTPFVIGVIIVLLCLFFMASFWKQPVDVREEYLPWLSLSFFAIIFSVITTVGRAGFGSTQASASRYTTVSLLLLIALVHLWRLTLSKKSYLKGSTIYLAASIFIMGFLATHFINGYVKSFSIAENAKYLKYQAKACVELIDYLEPEFASACIESTIYPDFSHVVEGLDKLRTVGLLDKQPSLDLDVKASAGNVYGHMGKLESLEFDADESVAVRGWALCDSPLPQADIRGVVFLKSSDSQYFFAMGHMQEKRPDIARAFNSEAYLHSGWTIPIEVKDLSTSETIISAYLYDFYKQDVFRLEGQVKLTFLQE
ncbi:MAG: hypothetical protein F6J95_032370 [Leptolyngbya sp. SIO1E4]|nr:hypothetical protein [Leptolyngbya sp. SIO1E4]